MDRDGSASPPDADGNGPPPSTDPADGSPTLDDHEAIAAAIGDPICALDPEGSICDVNDAAVETFGYDRAALVGEHVSSFVDEEDVRRCEATVAELVAKDATGSETLEVTVVAADGRRRRCEVTLTPLVEDGAFRGSVGVVRDVTAHRRREHRLAVFDRVLRHNLRNDINVIEGRAREVRNATTDGRIENHVDEIVETAGALLSLSETARRFDEMVGAEPSEREVVDLAELARERTPSSAEFDGGSFFVDAPPSAPALADPAVGQAIDELLDNAIQHFDGVALAVRVTVARDEEWVTVTVSDNGPGIPENDRAVLLGDEEAKLRQISGLGLWVVAWVVERSGGRVSYESADPSGAVVHLSFPRPADDGSDPDPPGT